MSAYVNQQGAGHTVVSEYLAHRSHELPTVLLVFVAKPIFVDDTNATSSGASIELYCHHPQNKNCIARLNIHLTCPSKSHPLGHIYQSGAK